MPLPDNAYTMSSPFGPREGGFHNGVDFAAPEGTAIRAAIEGTVAAAGPASGFGNWIVIDSQRPDGLVSTVYGHMYDSGVGVHTGEHVSVGQTIGAVGSAGESTGAHLHFEVWPGGRLQGGKAIDPLPWLAAVGPSQSESPASNAVVASRSGRRRVQTAGLAIGCDPAPVLGVELRADAVPAEYLPWIHKAATTFCRELTEPILAAQLSQESGFDRWARSPAGAIGPAQFMPGTWAAHGIDADGDGIADPFSIADAVMSQGKFACELIDMAKTGLAEGRLHGDLTQLWLSMYNCGPGATLAQGEVCQNAETLGYVQIIPNLAARFGASSKSAAPPDIRAGGPIR
ncbi:M23 family metallopeptidase [Nocardia panacis]|nr:M23 family metallopeptidase [Nocardia panacis]